MYSAMLGRFLSPNPVEGGNTGNYNYPNDPVNMFDLSGEMQDCGTCNHGVVTGSVKSQWGLIFQTPTNSGGGKTAYLAQQRQGPTRRVDLTSTARAIRNLAPSMIALAVVSANGGACSTPDAKAFITCHVRPGEGYFQSGTTYGNVFVSNKWSDEIPPDLRRHENAHSTQYGSFGPVGFLVLYGFDAWTAHGDSCQQIFEAAAGFEGGGYRGCY